DVDLQPEHGPGFPRRERAGDHAGRQVIADRIPTASGCSRPRILSHIYPDRTMSIVILKKTLAAALATTLFAFGSAHAANVTSTLTVVPMNSGAIGDFDDSWTVAGKQ